ncbi:MULTISPECIES: hypothetical protein [Nitratireductor]|uniref:hypothetical protein n=1 Tax=Nitratireductor TaxID=245876 RepID=UPI000D0DA88D|nr:MULTISPECIES: hypothetical protein [Nitratireductor]PSM17631.1 hypothetical protein C7T96_15025 [Nitratireductor sp. StC3]
MHPFVHRIAALALTSILFLTAGKAVAVETVRLGTVTAVIDAQAYQGETLRVPSEGTATATLSNFGPLSRVSVQAHAVDGKSRMKNVLVVEFSLMGAGPDAPASDPSISWWPEGMGAPFYVAGDEGGSVELTLDTLTLGGEPETSGSFVARLCRKQDMFSEPDADACIDVEGTFDTPLVAD